MSPTQNVKVQDLPTEIKNYEITELPSSSWEDSLSSWLKNISKDFEIFRNKIKRNTSIYLDTC